MILTQERAFLKARRQLREIEQFVEQAATDGQRIDLVERGLMARLLEIGRTMLEAFVAAQGDGDAGKELPAGEWLSRAVGILDLFHVLERLWDGAHVFHHEGSGQAAEFVNHHLRLLLEGKVGYVIGHFKRLRDQHALRGSQRRTLNTVIGYYENNRQHMRYDEYLAAGYPLGSGVAEGACRHLVKDRPNRPACAGRCPAPKQCCTCGPSTSTVNGKSS